MKFIPFMILSVMVLTVSCVYGQDAKTEKEKTIFSAKFYAVSKFQTGGLISGNSIEIPKSFSPTISWGREFGNYNEVELTNLRFQKKGLSKRLQIGSRYSYNWRLFSQSEKSRFSYYIGAGAEVIYSRNKCSSGLHGFAPGGCYGPSPSSENKFEANFSVIPRINYKIGKRIYLDLNVPYDFYSHSSSVKKIDEGQKFTTINSTTFPNKFTVNVGVAIKF